MKEKIERNIERTYGLIRKSIPYSMQVDSLEVVKQVEEACQLVEAGFEYVCTAPENLMILRKRK